MTFEITLTPEALRETSVRVSKLIHSKNYTYNTKMARELKYWTARPKLFRWATDLDYKQFYDFAVEKPPHGSIFLDINNKIRNLRKKVEGAQHDATRLSKVVLDEYALFQLRPELSDELLSVPFSNLQKAIEAYDQQLVARVPDDIRLYEAEQEEIAAKLNAAEEEWARVTTTPPVLSKAEICNFTDNLRRNRLVLKFIIPDFFGSSVAGGLWQMFGKSGLIDHRHEERVFLVTLDKDLLPDLHERSEKISAAIEAIYALHPDHAHLVSPSAAAKYLGIKTSEVRDLIEVGALLPRKIIEIKTGRLAGKSFHGIAPRDIIDLLDPTPSEVEETHLKPETEQDPESESALRSAWPSFRGLFGKR